MDHAQQAVQHGCVVGEVAVVEVLGPRAGVVRTLSPVAEKRFEGEPDEPDDQRDEHLDAEQGGDEQLGCHAAERTEPAAEDLGAVEQAHLDLGVGQEPVHIAHGDVAEELEADAPLTGELRNHDEPAVDGHLDGGALPGCAPAAALIGDDAVPADVEFEVFDAGGVDADAHAVAAPRLDGLLDLDVRELLEVGLLERVLQPVEQPILPVGPIVVGDRGGERVGVGVERLVELIEMLVIPGGLLADHRVECLEDPSGVRGGAGHAGGVGGEAFGERGGAERDEPRIDRGPLFTLLLDVHGRFTHEQYASPIAKPRPDRPRSARSSPGTDRQALLLPLKVVPGASRDRVMGVLALPDGARLKVAVSAPAESGKANRAVLALLRGAAGGADVELVSGHTSPLKIVRITGVAGDALPADWPTKPER